MKLIDVYKKWIPAKRRQVKETSLASYQLIYLKILNPEFGTMDVCDINKKNILPFIYRLLDGGKSKKYCVDILIVFKMILRFASDELELPVPDTTWKVTWPTRNKEAAPKLERYTNEEYKRIVEYTIANPSPRNLGILIVICSGMRIGEICALQWQDVDLDSRCIHVHRTLSRYYRATADPLIKGTTKVEIGSPKTASSDRYIPILKDIYPLVKKFSKVCKPDYYVCTCSKNFLEPRTYREYYNRFILKEVKLGRLIKFHALRHTFASVLIENKVDVKTVSTLLGHADISTTLNVYVHPTDDQKRNAVNAGLKNIFK